MIIQKLSAAAKSYRTYSFDPHTSLVLLSWQYSCHILGQRRVESEVTVSADGDIWGVPG